MWRILKFMKRREIVIKIAGIPQVTTNARINLFNHNLRFLI